MSEEIDVHSSLEILQGGGPEVAIEVLMKSLEEVVKASLHFGKFSPKELPYERLESILKTTGEMYNCLSLGRPEEGYDLYSAAANEFLEILGIFRTVDESVFGRLFSLGMAIAISDVNLKERLLNGYDMKYISRDTLDRAIGIYERMKM